ncbi:RNA polymerase sigma factor [Myxococcota bacterium]
MSRLVEDGQLRKRFRGGDPEALAQVYNEYLRPVFAHLSRGFMIESKGRKIWFSGFSDPLDLDDTVQEVFVRAFQEQARLAYDGLRPYLNFLLTIARNLVIDKLRRQTGRPGPLTESQGVLRHIGARPPQPDQMAESREIDAEVEAFIGGLTDSEREIFDTRFLQALSVEDTARALSISEYKVKRTEKSLRKRFFHAMRRKGYFDGCDLKHTWLSRESA